MKNKMTICCVFLSAAVFFSFAVTCFADDQELFGAIQACNVEKVEKLLIAGANPNAQATEEIVQALKLGDQLNFTPLASAISTVCLNESFGNDVARNMLNTKDIVKNIISLLMKHGARTDIMMKDQNVEDYSYPILHYPFHTDMARSIGDDYFNQMVKMGADYALVDSKGENALKYIELFNTQLSVQNIMSTGISFLQKNVDGSSQSFLFPYRIYDISFLKKWINNEKERGFHYDAIDFKKLNDWQHPIVKNFVFLSEDVDGNDPLFQNMDQKINVYKEVLLPFMAKAWNIPAGEMKIFPFGELMRKYCPNTEMNGVMSFSFGEYQDKKLYPLLSWMINSQDIDFSGQDINGVDLLSYAIHLCPFEIVQAISNKNPNLLNTKSASSLIMDFKKLTKDYGGHEVIFNNDHRTVNFLKSKKLIGEDLNLKSYGITNTELIKDNKELAWSSLATVGLDRVKGFNVQLTTRHLITQFVDIKRTVVNLAKSSGKQTMQFSNPLAHILIVSSPDSSRSLSLGGIRADTNRLDFEVRDHIFYFNLVGSNVKESVQGQVDLSEFDFDSKNTSLIIEEISSNKTRVVTRNAVENIFLMRGKRQNISLNNSEDLISGLSEQYKEFQNFSDCKYKMCNYLKFEKEGVNTFVSIDEDKLVKDDPALAQVWNYINTPIIQRPNFIKGAEKYFYAKTLSYFLDIISDKNTSKDEEQETLEIINLLVSREMMGALPFSIEPLCKKMGKITGLSDDGQAKIIIRNYFLGLEDLGQAYNSATSSFRILSDFLTWADSQTFSPLYRNKLDLLKNKIKNDFGLTIQQLNLTKEQSGQVSDLL